jgi:hypothetical protein
MPEFKVTFEFPDGHKSVYTGKHFRLYGIRHGNSRPFYVTLECLSPKDIYNDEMILQDSLSFFYKDLMAIMRIGTNRGRVMVKPAWFHKIIIDRK